MDGIPPALLALALGAAYIVKGDVDLVRGIVGSRRARRWLLPLSGVAISCVVVALGIVFQGLDDWPAWSRQVAAVALAGNLAYLLAAGQTAQHNAVRSE
jgi:hypothetical protein